MYGLCDCNNFFVSCERLFRPDLVRQPVVVLSNNDGCVIARSNEAKALGIAMGVPFYQIQSLVQRNGVVVFSANHELYGDISRRVMATLRSLVPGTEIYSIDEAFFELDGIDGSPDLFGHRIGRTIRRDTGIPASIGIAPTKTLAKVASKLAKRYPRLEGCCYMHRPEDVRKVLARFPIHDIWGIGRRYGRMFDTMRITTALEFVGLPEEWVRRRMGIAGVRTWHELQGEACIPFGEMAPRRQQITVSRSFPRELFALDELEPVVAQFAASCAEKLRGEGSLCREVRAFICTNPHREEAPQRQETGLVLRADPTDSTLELVRQARAALRQIYRPGFGYKRAGVLLSDIVPAAECQHSLFASVSDRTRNERLMKTLDRVNRTFGRGTLVVAAQGTEPFRTQQGHLGRRYTTQWDELPVVKAE